ncbi:MAG: Rab family GTPase [Promethearchaeota archaeon]
MQCFATFKICIFGDSGVGKTSLIHRLITNRFKQDMKLTIGADINAKDINLDNWRVKLQIWDFGGEERFKIFLPAYTRGSSGGIFMYDITRKNSLNNIDEWFGIFQRALREEVSRIPILVVGGKKDLDYYREVTLEDAEHIAQTHNLYDIIECSAKSGENVEYIFKILTYKMLEKIDLIC